MRWFDAWKLCSNKDRLGKLDSFSCEFQLEIRTRSLGNWSRSWKKHSEKVVGQEGHEKISWKVIVSCWGGCHRWQFVKGENTETDRRWISCKRRSCKLLPPGEKEIQSFPRTLPQAPPLCFSLCGVQCPGFPWDSCGPHVTFVFTVNLSLLEVILYEPNSHYFYRFRWFSLLSTQMISVLPLLNSNPLLL